MLDLSNTPTGYVKASALTKVSDGYFIVEGRVVRLISGGWDQGWLVFTEVTNQDLKILREMGVSFFDHF